MPDLAAKLQQIRQNTAAMAAKCRTASEQAAQAESLADAILADQAAALGPGATLPATPTAGGYTLTPAAVSPPPGADLSGVTTASAAEPPYVEQPLVPAN